MGYVIKNQSANKKCLLFKKNRRFILTWFNGLISCSLCNFLKVAAIRNWNAREMIHYNARDISVTREMALCMSINSRFSISMPKVDTFIRPVVRSGIAIDKSRGAKIPSHFLEMIFHRERFVAPGMRWTPCSVAPRLHTKLDREISSRK